MQSAKEQQVFRRGEVAALFQSGRTALSIAEQLQIPVRTVRRYVQRFKNMGEEGLVDFRKFNTGVRKTTLAEDNAIIEKIIQNPFEASSDVTVNLDLPVCHNTVRNRLREAGYHSRRPARKVLLTQTHREDRVAFALQQLPVTQFEWERTIFTDEKVFSTVSGKSLHVWRLRGDSRLDPKYVLPHNNSGRITCGMWGWVTPRGPGRLIEISPHMNSAEYIQILENVLVPSVRELYSVETMPVIRLVQDNSSVHTSAAVRAWFGRHPDIEVLQWPAKSPDLNIIEHVWAYIAKSWRPAANVRTRAALIDHVMCSWENLAANPRLFENLGKSIPKRLYQVIDRSGFWTDY